MFWPKGRTWKTDSLRSGYGFPDFLSQVGPICQIFFSSVFGWFGELFLCPAQSYIGQMATTETIGPKAFLNWPHGQMATNHQQLAPWPEKVRWPIGQKTAPRPSLFLPRTVLQFQGGTGVCSWGPFQDGWITIIAWDCLCLGPQGCAFFTQNFLAVWASNTPQVQANKEGNNTYFWGVIDPCITPILETTRPRE